MSIRPLLLVAALGVSAAAQSIVIRHDVPASQYLANEADFPFLFALYKTQTGANDCIASLIAPQWAITAAHCTEGKALNANAKPGLGYSVTIAGKPAKIDRIVRHGPGASGKTVDIALLHLSEPASHVRPVAVYRSSDELGRVVLFPGWGDTGDGKAGLTATPDGKFRVAENRIDDVHHGALFFEFDDPRSNVRGALAMEGISGPGDSGGPALIMTPAGWAIVGISSGQQTFGRPQGRYQAIEYYPRVSEFVDWIDQTTR